MSPERNDPCSCGSGKKYKKCCGLNSVQSRPLGFRANRAIAYKGHIGRLRQAFCTNYTEAKTSILREIGNSQKQDAESMGKSITCSQGCSACCSLFIAASLQECEAVVSYLYQNDEALRNFLRGYNSWIARIQRIATRFNRINSLHGKTLVSQESPEERSIFNADLAFYEEKNITCPFLSDGSCSIYEVRPYVCASVVSLSPAEWCRLSHPQYIQAKYLKTDFQRGNEMPYFLPLKHRIFFQTCRFSCTTF
jgi:Fe-S-cluster containining protein